jgi:hypothetical protein
MDADDISAPRRIEQQVDYMERNPDVVLLGVRMYERPIEKWIHGKICGKRNCTWALLFNNYIGHPGVMLRRNTLMDNGLKYQKEYLYVEDYKLWCDVTKFGAADVLNGPLLFYRRHERAASLLYAKQQQSRDRVISIEQIRSKLDVDMSGFADSPRQVWAEELGKSIFLSPAFRGLSQDDRDSIHHMFQEYSSRCGASLIQYIKRAGLRPVINGPAFGLRFLYRSARYRLRPSRI